MKRFSAVIAMVGILASAGVTQAGDAHFIFNQSAAGVIDVYVQISGSDTDGLSSYDLLLAYAEDPGNVGLNGNVLWTQNKLKTDDGNHGFWRALEPGETSLDVNRPSIATFGDYEFSAANTQFDSITPIPGVGMSIVSAGAGGDTVNLGVPAFLGTLSGLSGMIGSDFTITPDAGLFADGGITPLVENRSSLPAAQINVTHEAVSLVLGDFNRDGFLTNTDIQAMLDALVNLSTYQATHGLSNAHLTILGDINGDFQVTNTDIQALLDLLTGGDVQSVPEPATAGLLVLGLAALCSRGRKRRAA